MTPLTDYRAIFWDFDGVIKDSVAVKTAAFRSLFSAYGKAAQDWVQAHHEAHGGVSRFVKIPLYFEKITGKGLAPAEAELWCERFAQMVQNEVIESPWVPGVCEYLAAHSARQQFFLITGTPQKEIEQILMKLEIRGFFKRVVGAPKEKKEALADILVSCELSPVECIMIGDSLTDYHAAETNMVQFLLRETEENQNIFDNIPCPKIKDFSSENINLYNAKN